jgi:zinc transport system substrate-binding protein
VKYIVLLSTAFLLIVLLFFQNLYGQDQKSNLTLKSNLNAPKVHTATSLSSNLQNISKNLKVVSSFFPIGEFVKKIGGNLIESSLLVPVGSEPHDFEPTISQIQIANTADVLIYNDLGIDNWIAKINTANKIDASKGINATYTDKRNMTLDPHVWLDPILAKKEAENIRDGLIKLDFKNKGYYINNTKKFLDQLNNLDKTIRTDLQSCKKKDFISFHNAFSYFAKRYGLIPHSISSVSPEAEVTPEQLVKIINIAKDLQLHIIYSEELMDPRYASVIAQEIPNGKVLILSPVEGLTKIEQNSGMGYMEKMQQNVRNLMQGLDCIKS